MHERGCRHGAGRTVPAIVLLGTTAAPSGAHVAGATHIGTVSTTPTPEDPGAVSGRGAAELASGGEEGGRRTVYTAGRSSQSAGAATKLRGTERAVEFCVHCAAECGSRTLGGRTVRIVAPTAGR
uniref:Alpha-1,4-glucan:maltose-1-phosphate maltosyltransferase n=1 Tax=Lygus hesperus TaxID=30085 RepID=A0A0A9ZIX9_LYGHE